MLTVSNETGQWRPLPQPTASLVQWPEVWTGESRLVRLPAMEADSGRLNHFAVSSPQWVHWSVRSTWTKSGYWDHEHTHTHTHYIPRTNRDRLLKLFTQDTATECTWHNHNHMLDTGRHKTNNNDVLVPDALSNAAIAGLTLHWCFRDWHCGSKCSNLFPPTEQLDLEITSRMTTDVCV